jgi:hypothetical protein
VSRVGAAFRSAAADYRIDAGNQWQSGDGRDDTDAANAMRNCCPQTALEIAAAV